VASTFTDVPFGWGEPGFAVIDETLTEGMDDPELVTVYVADFVAGGAEEPPWRASTWTVYVPGATPAVFHTHEGLHEYWRTTVGLDPLITE